MDWITHYLIEKKTYFWRVNKLPGGNHTFPAELKVEFMDIERNLSVSSVQSLSHVWLLRPHGLQHARLLCPSPISGGCSNLRLSHQLCHPTVSSSVVPFSSCLQSFPALGSFPMSQFFASGGQSIRTSASASVLPMNISFRMDWLDLLAVQGTLKGLLQHHSSKTSIL